MLERSLTKSETDPILAKFLSMFNHNRKRILKQLSDVTDEMIDYTPDPKKFETIGTLLYHIAAIDWSYVFEDMDGREWDNEKWKYGMPLRSNNMIDQLTGKGKQFYIDLITKERDIVMQQLSKFTDDDLTRDFSVAENKEIKFTLEWILYHLINHEAVHEGQINFMKRLYRLEHGG